MLCPRSLHLPATGGQCSSAGKESFPCAHALTTNGPFHDRFNPNSSPFPEPLSSGSLNASSLLPAWWTCGLSERTAVPWPRRWQPDSALESPIDQPKTKEQAATWKMSVFWGLRDRHPRGTHSEACSGETKKAGVSREERGNLFWMKCGWCCCSYSYTNLCVIGC